MGAEGQSGGEEQGWEVGALVTGGREQEGSEGDRARRGMREEGGGECKKGWTRGVRIVL